MSRSPLELALAGAGGVVLGIVLALALAGGGDGDGEVVTVTAPAPAATAGDDATVITRSPVPEVVGERLDIAIDRVRRQRFLTKVEGGGAFGVVREQNWEVVAQEPPAGTLAESGSTVQLSIERR